MTTVEYLEEERQKLWAKVTSLEKLIEQKIPELEEQINKKTPEDEAEAKQASRKCTEYKHKCVASYKEADQQLEAIKKVLADTQEAHKETSALSAQIRSNAEIASASSQEIQVTHDQLNSKKEALNESIDELETLFAKHPTYAANIEKLEELYESADDYLKKISANFNQLIKRKNEIDAIYYEIIGSTTPNPETGEDIKITGKRAELDDAYTELQVAMTNLGISLDNLKNKATRDFDEFAQHKDSEFNLTAEKWKAEYAQVQKKINDLLPDALTKGLSFAYYRKRRLEATERKSHEGTFMWAVLGLVLISLIPFGAGAYFLLHGTPLEETIYKLPRLTFSIFPLYIPVLWIAYSANRRVNLSKRLIEEYTHKEVLSKTYEGLSTQIQDIEDTAISSELRTKLLYNMLEISSENPGKLISDYNKADHPLMDALDKSVKLTNAVEKLAKLPGMSKLANYLDNKSKLLLAEETQKANTGISMVDQTDSESASSPQKNTTSSS